MNIPAFVLAATLGLFAAPAAAQVDASPWGARAPATCTPLRQTTAPTPAQAARLLRCARESASQGSGELWLMEDLVVEVGGPAPFATLYPLITMPGVDPAKPVHPLRGSWTWSVCMLRADAAHGGKDPGLNCRETPVGEATGGCWRTTFGDWKCAMNGRSGTSVAPTRPRRG